MALTLPCDKFEESHSGLCAKCKFPLAAHALPIHGADTVFESGARRSVVMPFFSAIPYESLRRVALRATGAPAGDEYRDENGFLYAGGSLKYGYRNWANGLPFEDTLNHAINHLLSWKSCIEHGVLPADDELSAVAWAVLLPLMTFERQYRDQYRARNAMMDLPSGTKVAAEDADRMMRERFQPYLLQQLSPAKPPR